MWIWIKKHVWMPLYEAVLEWQEDDGDLLAASMAYYAVLSFFPLLLILVSALGVFLQFSTGQDAQEQFIALIAERVSANAADNVRAVLAGISENAGVGGPVGLLVLLFAAIGIFTQFERAFDRIWDVKAKGSSGIFSAVRNALVERLRAFLMLLGVGILMLAAFIANMAAAAVRTYATATPGGVWAWKWGQLLAGIALNALLFGLIYRFLPKVKVDWSAALRGGVLAAILWEVTRQFLAAIVIGEKYNAYGVVGSLIAVMLWVYIASTILFFGAEYAQVYCKRCRIGNST